MPEDRESSTSAGRAPARAYSPPRRPRIFAPPRGDSPFAPQISGGQLFYALTARPNGYLKRDRRGQYTMRNVPDHYQEYAVSAFVVRSLVRQGLLEERRNGYYPVRNRTATYRGEGRTQRPTRMPYREDE